ncbi:MAG: hypothetical protein HY344_04555 [Candidatus Levybacteria bacterium]|nr:hypothetical protein [Candidatus Levybacteria bacterium]
MAVITEARDRLERTEDLTLKTPLLNYRQTWIGMILTVYEPRRGELLHDPSGEPLKVIMQIGGTMPVRPGYYRLDKRAYSLDRDEDVPTLEQVEFSEECLFIPCEVFPTLLAPPNQKCAVFNHRRKLEYDFGFGGPVWGYTDEEGVFQPGNIPRNMKREQFVLPDTAISIPLHDKWRRETEDFWVEEERKAKTHQAAA